MLRLRPWGERKDTLNRRNNVTSDGKMPHATFCLVVERLSAYQYPSLVLSFDMHGNTA